MFRLTDSQTRELLMRPESGMGYQVVEATLTNNTTARGVAYNGELLLLDEEPRAKLSASYRNLMESAKSAAGEIKALRVMPQTGTTTFSVLRESSVVKKDGPARDAPKESAKAGEIFKRFSAYQNDHRVMP